MKLRISGNSVRVRLTRGETARLGAGEKVQQVADFAFGHKLVSSVSASVDATTLWADFDGKCISVVLPLNQAKAWAAGQAVSIEAFQPIDEGRSLHVLIEKDFECLHSKPEENTDAFPNPRA